MSLPAESREAHRTLHSQDRPVNRRRVVPSRAIFEQLIAVAASGGLHQMEARLTTAAIPKRDALVELGTDVTGST